MGTIKLPPPVSKKKQAGSAYQQFINYWTAKGYSHLRENAAAIYAAAKAAHIDPITFAALTLNESGANFASQNSRTGAMGIAQLEPTSFIGPHAFNGGVLPWAPKHHVTLADLQNPGINLRLGAYYFAWLNGQHPDAPYGYYNAGPNANPAVAQHIQQTFTNTWVTPWNPKYVPQPSSTAPPGKVGEQVPGGTAPPAADIPTFKDPFVAGVDKHGKLVTSFNPNKAIQYDGVPLTRTGFLSLRDQLTSHYVSYTGQRPSLKQISTYVQKGWDTYTLDVLLSKGKNFTKSPIYKQYSANYTASVKDLLPKGTKVPDEILRQAIVNNWSGDVVAQKLRALPTYLDSNEYGGNVATLLNTYQSIMGKPDQQAMLTIHDAALAGWNSDQLASYLRSQKGYTQSQEYQSKAMSFLGALGMITGSQVTLQGAVPTDPAMKQALTPYSGPPLPSDKRVAGTPGITRGPLSGLAVNLG